MRSQCGLWPTGIADARALPRQPLHRREFAEVSLFSRREHLRRRCRTAMQIRPLERDEFDAAARLFADAFLRRSWVGCRWAGSGGASAWGAPALSPHRAGCHPAVWRADLWRLRRTAVRSPALPPPSPPASIPRRPGPFSGSSPAFCSPGPGRSSAGSASQPSRRRGIRMTSTSISGSSPSTRAHQRGGVGRALLARVYGGRQDAQPRLPRHGQPGQRALLREQRLRGDRQGRRSSRRVDVVYEASLRRCASGSPSSFFSVLFSIWRIRSRVTPNARPDLLERPRLLARAARSASRSPRARAAAARPAPARTFSRRRFSRRLLERRLGRVVLDEVAQLGVLLLADRLLERHRQLRDPQDVLHLARRPLELDARSPRESARGRTPAPAAAPRARPCSASPPCAPGCGSCAPCRRSPASPPGGSTTSRTSRTCSRAGSRTSRPRGSGPASPPGSGPGTTARARGSPSRSTPPAAGSPRSSAAWPTCRRARSVAPAPPPGPAVSRSTRPIERRYSRSESSDGSTVRSISGFFGAEPRRARAPGGAVDHARRRRTTVLRHDVHARLDEMRAELGDLLLRDLDLLETRGDLLECQDNRARVPRWQARAAPRCP